MSYSIEQFKSLLSKERGLASSNMFRVLMPSLQGKLRADGTTIDNYSSESINLLCRATELPGRQIMTLDRQIGMLNTKVAHGFAAPEITLSFQCTNSYLIRRYFEDWQQIAISNKQGVQYHSGYYNEYSLPVKIAQIRKPESFALFSKKIGKDLKLPNIVEDALPTIGGVNFRDLAEGRIDIALVSKENVVYECLLENAFPTSITPITLANTADTISEFSVSLSYMNWFDVSPGTENTISDDVVGLINKGVSLITSIFD